MRKSKRSKYGSNQTTAFGKTFASRREADRYLQLEILQKTGEIAGLTTQVPFVLAPAVKINGEKRSRPAVRYYLDFLYTTKEGKFVYEDAKGIQTAVYRLKKHLMKTVHNIDVTEV